MKLHFSSAERKRSTTVGKIAEKAVCVSALYFECRINKNSFRLFFGDFAHWDVIPRARK